MAVTTLAFSTSDVWYSRVIRWVMRSKVSHVMIGTKRDGADVFLHATLGGVQETLRSEWLRDNQIVCEYLFKPDVQEGIKHARTHLGENYDYVALVGWGWVNALRAWLKVRARNPFTSTTAMICSELVLHVDMACPNDAPGDTIPEWRGLDPEQATPQDLLDRMPGLSFIEVHHAE